MAAWVSPQWPFSSKNHPNVQTWVVVRVGNVLETHSCPGVKLSFAEPKPLKTVSQTDDGPETPPGRCRRKTLLCTSKPPPVIANPAFAITRYNAIYALINARTDTHKHIYAYTHTHTLTHMHYIPTYIHT
jgi:hypothetical protein